MIREFQGLPAPTKEAVSILSPHILGGMSGWLHPNPGPVSAIRSPRSVGCAFQLFQLDLSVILSATPTGSHLPAHPLDLSIYTVKRSSESMYSGVFKGPHS